MQAAADRLEGEKRLWQAGTESRQALLEKESSIRTREAELVVSTAAHEARIHTISL